MNSSSPFHLRFTARALSLAAIGGLALVCGAAAQTPLLGPLDRVLESCHQRRLFDGVALVSSGEQILYTRAFGLADQALRLPHTRGSRFPIASLTKPIIARLVQQLERRGVLDLDTPAATLLPEARLGAGITLRHLVDHSSGLGSFDRAADFDEARFLRPWHRPQFIRRFCADPPEDVPGVRSSYSNTGYFLLGTALERSCGRPLQELLRDVILLPLRMEDTDFPTPLGASPISPRSRLATGYRWIADTAYPCALPHPSASFSAAGLCSTVDDLQRLARDLFVDGALRRRLSGRSSWQWGWRALTLPAGERMMMHTGAIAGHSSLMALYAKDERCIILLSNLRGAPLTRILAAMTSVLDGETPRLPRRSIVPELLARIKDRPSSELLRWYRSRARGNAHQRPLGASALRRLAEDLQAVGRRSESRAVRDLLRKAQGKIRVESNASGRL